SIEKGEPFQIPNSNLQIYADKIIVEDHPKDTQADSRMHLWHVAAAEIDRDGHINMDVTANQAAVDVYRRQGRTLLKLVMTETVAYKPESGDLARQMVVDPPRAIVVPSAVEEKTKTFTHGQLIHLREHPDDYRQVSDIKDALAEAIIALEVRQAMDA